MNLNVKPIRDIVYEELKKAIMAGELKSGERIVEKNYAEKMNISRTPVREALRKLEMEGLVEYIPRKGVIVKGFELKDIIEIYDIRKALECLAIKHVIDQITEEQIKELEQLDTDTKQAEKEGRTDAVFNISKTFSEVLIKRSNMPRLIGMINTLQEYLMSFRRVTMAKDQRRQRAIKEHSNILQAIKDKDYKQAEELVGQHIEGSKEVFLQELQLDK